MSGSWGPGRDPQSDRHAIATSCCVHCCVWPPEGTRGLYLRPSGADPGGSSWRRWLPRRLCSPSLVLEGCGSEHSALCGSCGAPWDLGAATASVVVQKIIKFVGRRAQAPAGAGGWLAGGGYHISRGGPGASEGRTRARGWAYGRLATPQADPSRTSWQNIQEGFTLQRKSWAGPRRRGDPARPVLRFRSVAVSAAGLSQRQGPCSRRRAVTSTHLFLRSVR